MLSSISNAGIVMTTSLCLALVGANPLPAATPDQALSLRGPNEALYLANCVSAVQSGAASNSQMAYYSNGRSGSQHGETPDNFAWLRGVVTWEGQSQTGTFQNNGGSATSNIMSGAHDFNTGAFAGTARNSFGQNFNCYKDNYRVLYQNTDSRGVTVTCKSIYYCFDA